MSLLSRVLDWLMGAGPATDEPDPMVRCQSERGLYQRHIYEGEAACKRGCGATNPKHREPAAVPTEG